MFLHITLIFLDRRATPKSSSSSTSMYQRTVALGRYVSYRRFTGRLLAWFGLPPFGMLAFLMTTIVFLAALRFAIKPYYGERLGYGSPPLAIRSGLMAFAYTPILIALAGKANLITLLTGISHEKLNVIHCWVAWMSFALSLAHTLPYFLQANWDGASYHMKVMIMSRFSFIVMELLLVEAR